MTSEPSPQQVLYRCILRSFLILVTICLMALAIAGHFYNIQLTFGHATFSFNPERVWVGIFPTVSSRWFNCVVLKEPSSPLSWWPSTLIDRYATVVMLPWWTVAAAWLSVAIAIWIWAKKKRPKATGFSVEVPSNLTGK